MTLADAVARIRQLDAVLGSAVPAPAPADSATFAAALSQAAAPPAVATGGYGALVDSAASRYGVDPRLVEAVLQTESGGDPTATSAAGAQGLMQLMPATAQSLGVADPYDPAQSIDGGTRYLRGLLDRFGGNEQLAVAAYNAGPGAVERYGGVPPYPETQSYVRQVLSRAEAA